MGCNIPRIPGYASSALVTPGGNDYTCIATPQSILARATYTVDYANKPTVTRSASFVATATAGAAEYVNFGCYPDADQTTPLNGQEVVPAASLAGSKVSVDSCVTYCQGKSKDWVGVRGGFNGGNAACLCGTDKLTLGNIGDMQICAGPCDGTDNTQNCGPERGILAYALSASATTGDWYSSWSTTFSFTSTYSCKETASTSSSAALSTTSSAADSTTSSAADSTTSSAADSTTSSAAPASTSSTAGATSTNSEAVSTTSSANADVSSTSSAANPDTSSTAATTDSTSTANADASNTSSTANGDVSSTSTAADASNTSDAGNPDTSSTSTAAADQTSTTGGSGSESTGGPASGDASSTGMQSTPDSTIAQTTLSTPTNGPGGDSTTGQPSSTGQQGGDSTGPAGGEPTSSNGSGPGGASTSGGEGPATSGDASSTGGQGPATSDASPSGSQGPSSEGQGPATSAGASTSGGQGPATSGGDFSSPGSEPTSPGGESSATPATRTSTSSGIASSTSAAPIPTITLGSLEVKKFSALFSGEVPVAKGAFVPLVIYDANGNPSQQSYVVELLGCFLVPDGQVPFSGKVADFKGNERAGASASSCAGFCAGTGLKLSANNGGVCYCGDQVEFDNLSSQSLQSCSTPCPDGSGEICGGGDRFQKRWLSRRANTFVTIIVAVPANNVVLYNTDGVSYPPVSISASISASGGVASNSATGTESASATGTGNSSAPTGSATDGGNVPTGSATGPGASNVPSGSATDGGNVPTGSMTGSDGSVIPSGSMTAGPSGTATTGPASSTGAAGSGSAGSTGPGASATNSAGIPGVTDLPQTPVLLSVIPGLVNATNQKRDFAEMYRRQALGGFIGAAGPINPASCSDATPFNLTQGRLMSGGEMIATDPNVPYIPMKVVPGGSISTTFTVVNGILFWYNAAFFGGQAAFCQIASGQVYATFGAPGTGPANCNAVSIVVYQANQCQNGALSTATPPSVAPAAPALLALLPLLEGPVTTADLPRAAASPQARVSSGSPRVRRAKSVSPPRWPSFLAPRLSCLLRKTDSSSVPHQAESRAQTGRATFVTYHIYSGDY
ncbi:hypothetical protein PG988_002432 [Apiospora saccharicola]